MRKVNDLLKKYSWIFLFLLPFICIRRVLDNDIWFMLNHGRYLLDNGLFSGGFATIEPFTVHEGLAFSFEKWATCVLFWIVYKNFSVEGLFVLIYIMAIAIEDRKSGV